ncbi:hypothetical protein ACFLU6_06945, partial [Acidobacteriota bacterium]
MPSTPPLFKSRFSAHAILFVPLLLCMAASPSRGERFSTDPSLIFLNLEPDPAEGLAVGGFSVIGDVDILIQAQGAGVGDDMFAYPWILNAGTREVVWKMTLKNSRKESSKDRSFEGSIRLKPGSYLVYFTFLRMRKVPIKVGPIEDWLKGTEDEPTDWGITLSTSTAADRDTHITGYRVIKGKEPVVSIRCLGDNAFIRTHLRLESDSTIRIYAVGEGLVYANMMADYSWIIDSATRKRVWEMTIRNTKYAGGAPKNLAFDGKVELPAGDYELFTISDDTHSAQSWNSLPPYDPEWWGITIWAEEGSVSQLPLARQEVLVRMTGLGDNESVEAMFNLESPASVHIYAFGEWQPGSSEMQDYGWIVQEDSNLRVWKMTPKESAHGGGNVKNRLFDGTLRLNPGRYTVYYRTDYSHSFGKWNEAPPFDPAAYGITVTVPAGTKGWSQIASGRGAAGKDVLVQIIRVKDDAHHRERFTLTEPAELRVYALGEGSGGRMVDYAWIETATGEPVWKMDYKSTNHAGGGSKNRLFDGVLALPAGEYVVHYKTDDSHSFEDWNVRKPDDPESWGVTLYQIQSKNWNSR